MAGSKADILWSPNHKDRFLTFGADVVLYKVAGTKDDTLAKGMKISDDLWANLVSTNSSPENQYMKCLAWYPHKDPDHLMAVGMASGKVILQSFSKGGLSDPRNLIGREFIPKHARPCSYLAWHPTVPNLLAQGLEKYRADCCTVIWDVNSKYEPAHDLRKYSASSADTMSYKPYAELGQSETSLSFAWFPSEPNYFITGMNNKFLRIYDLRDTTRTHGVAYSKSVYGIKVDPHFEHRLASFNEGQISIWDVRNFDKPVLTLCESRPVMKVAWSPTRSGLLACLTKESSVIKLFDIQSTPVGSDELEPAVIEKIIQPIAQQQIAAYDWHPTVENRMITISHLSKIRDIQVHERIAIDWSADIHLTWACGRQTKQMNCVKFCEEAADDISIKMKRRALKGYGLHDKVLQNTQYVNDDSKVKNFWVWVHYLIEINSSAKSEASAAPSTPPGLALFFGVKQILTQLDNRSESDPWSWQGVEGFKFRSFKNVYRSEARVKALHLCGWGYEQDSPSLAIIDRLEKDGAFERAAAISIFTLKLKRAIQLLKTAALLQANQGTDNNYHIVAMALSGFSDERNSLWKEMCSSLSSQLTNPYLRATFSFLTAENDSYLNILNESGIEISDRVAMACMYLPDNRLNNFVESLSQSLSSAGNLDGILLTGLTLDSLDLFEQYIDNTGDVQSVSLALIQGSRDPELAQDPRFSTWIQCYRDLLDQWRLWNQRAEFDVFRNTCDPTHRPQSQVYVSCNFCGKSISSASHSNRSRHFMYGSGLTHKSKVSSCPGCRKPLPRCALCLINMGTSAGSGKAQTPDGVTEDPDHKLTNISDWFTWCQTCRHGGHAAHMAQWFNEQTECPVTGCTCKCTLLDSMAPVMSADSLVS